MVSPVYGSRLGDRHARSRADLVSTLGGACRATDVMVVLEARLDVTVTREISPEPVLQPSPPKGVRAHPLKVGATGKQTRNAVLDAGSRPAVPAGRYERTEVRKETRVGSTSYCCTRE